MILLWLLFLGFVASFSDGRTVKGLGSTLKWHPSKESRRTGKKALPSKIDLTLKFKKTVYLNLVKENDNIEEVQVFSKIKLTDEYKQKAALYKDLTNHAIFSVGLNKSKVTYYGEFVYNNVVWSLMPFLGFVSEYQKGKGHTYEVTLNETKHYLQKERVHVGPSTGNDAGQKSKFNESLVNKADSEARKRLPPMLNGKQLYTIEILIILDHSVYLKWLHNANGNHDATLTNLKQYYAHVVNGVKERYEGVELPGLSYTASLSGIYIITSVKDASFVESTRSGVGLNTLQTIESVTGWVQKNRKSFPEFDVAALFTNYPLLPNFNGYAWIGAACTTRGVSINRDVGSFDTILTASHEIGHNLGAYHDSEGNNCKHEDQYVMAKGRMHDKGRLFTFSSCSLHYFQNFNRYLLSKNIMCLNNIPENVFPKDIDQYLNQHPGQKLTLDEQCKAIHGKNSYFCGGGNEQNLCMRMACLNQQNMCQETAAAEGTSCGNRKWCHRGECVYDDRAPTIKKDCNFGEYKGITEYSGYQYRCSELIQYFPWLCYQDYYKSRCCESCDNLRKQKPQGCPYGDRNKGCDIKYCSTMDYAKDCCETCKSVKFDQHGKMLFVCENEKFDSRCQTFLDNIRCYDLGKLCCNACARYEVNISGCEYGDKALWCADHISRYPDSCKTNKATCCKSCYGKH